MSILYISLLSLFSIGLLFFILFTIFRKDEYRRKTLFFLIPDLLIVLSQLSTALIKNIEIVYSLMVVQVLSILWFLFYFTNFAEHITDTELHVSKRVNKLNSKKVRIFQGILTILDSIFVIVISVKGVSFKLLPHYFYGGKLMGWTHILYPPFIIHAVLYSCFVIILVIKDLGMIFHTESFYRKIYLYILTLLGILIAIDILNLYLDTCFDYSIFAYPILAMLTCGYYFFYFPKDRNDLLISLISADISSAIACFDFEEHCIYTNKAADSIFQGNENKFVNAENFLQKSWVHEFLNKNSDSVYGDETIEINGEKRVFKIYYQIFKDSKKQIIGSYIKLDDQTEEVAKLNEAKYKAYYDDLTGLLNRRTFFTKTEEIIKATPSIPRYMIATNIKNFKLINDLFGAKLGDSILKKQAKMLSKANYSDTIIGRITSDKFAMLIQKNNFKQNMAVENTLKIQEITKSLNYQLKIYIGVYEITDTSENPIIMFDKAQLAIKNIEGDYKQTLAFYDSFMMEKIYKEKSVLSEFSRAIQNNEFKMYLQPLTTRNGHCISAEALVRWQHPLLGTLAPNYFLEIFERTGYIFTLDKFIWEQACRKISDWQKEGKKPIPISINISTKDFYYADLYITITNLVEKYKIAPELLKLEITETVFMENTDNNMEVINSLKDYGFTIEIDDFGSGYSSLNMLKELNSDVLKIDMGFIEETKDQNKSEKILKSIINMAKDMEMSVVTEGVETEKQLKMVTKAGCHVYQGFYFSKPITVADFEKQYLKEDSND